MASAGGRMQWPTLGQTPTPSCYVSSWKTTPSHAMPHPAVERSSAQVTTEGGGCEPLRISAKSTDFRNEFDGPTQLLPSRSSDDKEPTEQALPQLPVTLSAQEQDYTLSAVNDCLSQCAFDFVARYQFPIPVEPDKRPVRVPSDREWSEWVHLLKRLATKRRITARVLWNGQIKQFITILENSLEIRHAAKHQSRPLTDDRNILMGTLRQQRKSGSGFGDRCRRYRLFLTWDRRPGGAASYGTDIVLSPPLLDTFARSLLAGEVMKSRLGQVLCAGEQMTWPHGPPPPLRRRQVGKLKSTSSPNVMPLARTACWGWTGCH